MAVKNEILDLFDNCSEISRTTIYQALTESNLSREDRNRRVATLRKTIWKMVSKYKLIELKDGTENVFRLPEAHRIIKDHFEKQDTKISTEIPNLEVHGLIVTGSTSKNKFNLVKNIGWNCKEKAHYCYNIFYFKNERILIQIFTNGTIRVNYNNADNPLDLMDFIEFSEYVATVLKAALNVDYYKNFDYEFFDINQDRADIKFTSEIPYKVKVLEDIFLNIYSRDRDGKRITRIEFKRQASKRTKKDSSTKVHHDQMLRILSFENAIKLGTDIKRDVSITNLAAFLRKEVKDIFTVITPIFESQKATHEQQKAIITKLNGIYTKVNNPEEKFRLTSVEKSVNYIKASNGQLALSLDVLDSKITTLSENNTNQDNLLVNVANAVNIQSQSLQALLTRFDDYLNNNTGPTIDPEIEINFDDIAVQEENLVSINYYVGTCKERILALLNDFKDGLTRKEISSKINMKIGSVNGTIRRLIDNNHLVVEDNKKLFLS